MFGTGIVDCGAYGDNFIILLSGKCQVMRDTDETGHHTALDRDDSLDQIVDAADREPVLGFMACLPQSDWNQVRQRTDDWVCTAVSYVDTAWVTRADILTAFRDTWADGQKEISDVAFHHYEVSREDDFDDVVEETVELDGALTERIDQLNVAVTARMQALEAKMDRQFGQLVALIGNNQET